MEETKESEISDTGTQIEEKETNISTQGSEATSSNIPGPDDSGVEILSGPSTAASEEEEDIGFVLGDHIQLETKVYGKMTGRIYYIDETLIRILPDGISHRVFDYPIVDGGLDPALGIDPDAEIIFEPGPRTPFVEYLELRESQLIDTYKADGTFYKTYKVVEISQSENSISIQDKEKSSDELKVEFDTHGIPRDLPFAVIGITPTVEEGIESSDVKESENETESEENEEGTNQELDTEQQVVGVGVGNLVGSDELVDPDGFETIGQIELPTYMVASELAPEKQTFPDIVQKSDFLNTILSTFDSVSQQNPVYLKRIRALSEMLSSLKNTVIKRTESGDIIGEMDPSVRSLSNIVKNRGTPLVRPVLGTKRILQLDLLEDTDQTEKETEDLVIQTLTHTLRQVQDWIDGHDGLPVSLETPRFYQWLQGLLARFPLGDQFIGSGYTFPHDGEFFREEAPTTDTVEGLPILERAFEEFDLNDEYVGTVNQSLRRGLGITVRKGPNGGLIQVIPPNRASVKSYVLFPPTVNRYIGTTRTGKLAEDVTRSHLPYKSMSDIIQALGSIGEIQDAGKILLLKSDENTLANMPFDDYLKTILPLITPRGLGDCLVLLRDLGIDDIELTKEQSEILQGRVNIIIQSLKGYIRKLRASISIPTSGSNSLLDENDNAFIKRLDSIVETIPIIKTTLLEFGRKTPGYKSIDIAIFGYLLKMFPDLTLAALGTNERALLREQNRAIRGQYVDILVQAQKIKQLALESGQAPEINPCPHVKKLTQIRKVSDDNRRLPLLADFIRKFKGGREDNWITCRVCDTHLVCHHELLQLQQFIHPREFDAIQKQIVLTYAGGRFGSKYICRNCGLPISTLDYDHNIEFDDSGKPMSGRDVIVDTDAINEEEIMKSLSDPLQETDLVFDDERKKQLYEISKFICDRIGIFLDTDGYTMVINAANQRLLMQPTPQRYGELMKGKKGPDYATHMSILSISLLSCMILVNIQSHVPDYVVRYVYPGCKPGLQEGYPLREGAEPTASPGLQYIACVLNGVNEHRGVWGQTGWQEIRSDKDREATIFKKLVQTMGILMDGNPILQMSLQAKRAYLKQIYGQEAGIEKPTEKIPDEFLPTIETLDAAKENAAKEPTVSTGVKGNAGKQSMAQAWVRSANVIADETARKVQGSPFAETACCFSKSSEPQGVLKQKESSLPGLPSHEYTKKPTQKSWLFVPYKTRPLVNVDASVSNDVIYRIFMSLCWRESRIGLPHEFGYDNKCDWCGLQLPMEYVNPDVDKSGTIIFNNEILLQSFTDQGIPISNESFEHLLDISHKRLTFKLYLGPKPKSPMEVVHSLDNLVTPPIANWQGVILATLDGISRIPPGATEIEIGATFSPLTNVLGVVESYCRGVLQTFEVKSKIPEKRRRALTRLDSIFNEEFKLHEIIRTYFVVPLARVSSGYNRSSLKVSTVYNLSPDHREDIRKFIESHTENIAGLEKSPLDETSMQAVKIFVSRVSEFLGRGEELKKSRIPFGSVLLGFINRLAFFGPLYDLLKSSLVSEGLISLSRDVLLKFFLVTLEYYESELLSYNTESIRDALAKEVENEKNEFIDYLDKMSPEMKKIELAKKNLGLGRWSIGGTKLIWAYDKEQYDKERTDNLEKYSDVGRDGVPAVGREVDLAGMLDYGAEYDNLDNGYDAQEEAEDDF
jgi:hypothetical protein